MRLVECGGIGRVISVEELLLFEGKTEEVMERYTRMLNEMWTERMRLME